MVYIVTMDMVADISATPIDEQCKLDFYPNKVKMVLAMVSVASLHYLNTTQHCQHVSIPATP